MAGVRVIHDDLRGVPYTVAHPTRKYREPYLCPACRKVHTHKTYHLDLDGEGAAIVSSEVFQRLREAGMPGLTLANEVKSPPAQHIRLKEGAVVGVFADAVQEYHYQGKTRRLHVLKNRLLAPRRTDG